MLVGYGTAEAGDPARRVGGRPHRRPTARLPAAAPAAGDRRAAPGAARAVPVISPLVRRLAREHGLDLRQLAPAPAPTG